MEPDGIGEGISLADPCVLGGFLVAEAPEADAAVELVWVVPDCSQDARKAMPIRTTMKENTCFLIICSVRILLNLWLS